jgi:hypothetical protein
MPGWALNLRNLYWMLRYYRKWDEAKRRKYYRRIEAEKKRLHAAGVDPELVRLLCRHLANPKDRFAEARYLVYSKQGRLFGPINYTSSI